MGNYWGGVVVEDGEERMIEWFEEVSASSVTLHHRFTKAYGE